MLALAAAVTIVAIFVLQEGDTIQENFENRPQLVIATPGPPAHQWSEQQALDFFREYAIVRPAPEIEGLSASVQTCWDYAMHVNNGSPSPFKIGVSAQSAAVPLGASIPVWGVAAVDENLWRFWENTKSVVGPC